MTSLINSKIRDAIISVRQLCSLGLEEEILVPALLERMHDLIPSESNVFEWADEAGNLTHILMEPHLPTHIPRLYMEEFYNKRETEVRPAFSVAIKQEKGITDWEQYYGRPHFLSTDFYNLIFRPCHVRYTLRAYIPNSRRNLGVLILRRGLKDRPFDEKEKSLLSQVTSYIAYGISSAGSTEFQDKEAHLWGTVLLDKQGNILDACRVGMHLLELASLPKINDIQAQCAPPTISLLLKQLSRQLIDTFRDKTVPSPAFRHETPWGVFTFYVCLLDHSQTSTGNTIALQIRYHEPLPVKLIRCMKNWPLSPAQKEVCLHLLNDCSYSQIADKMHVSSSCVHDHIKKIYKKLDVHSQRELFEKILADPPPLLR